MKLRIITSIILILSITYFTHADIPTHCKKSQVVGTWTIKATKGEVITGDAKYQYTCGHNNPTFTETAYKVKMDESLFTEEIIIEMQPDDSVAISLNDKTSLKGIWTMVYDEGFDIRINKEEGVNKELSYFAFLRYDKNDKTNKNINSNYASYCYETLIGWFKDGEKQGCFKAHKNVPDHDKPTNGEVTDKQIVTENSMTPASFLEKSSNKLKTNSNLNTNKDNLFNFYSEETRFMESKFSTKLQMNSQFKDHAKFVDQVNSANLSWKAENYEMFENKSLEEINKMAGRKKAVGKEQSKVEILNNINNSRRNNRLKEANHELDSKNVEQTGPLNKLPLKDSLDFEDIMPAPKSQVIIYFEF